MSAIDVLSETLAQLQGRQTKLDAMVAEAKDNRTALQGVERLIKQLGGDVSPSALAARPAPTMPRTVQRSIHRPQGVTDPNSVQGRIKAWVDGQSQHHTFRAKEVADATGIPADQVMGTLGNLHRAGKIRRVMRGLYQPASREADAAELQAPEEERLGETQKPISALSIAGSEIPPTATSPDGRPHSGVSASPVPTASAQ